MTENSLRVRYIVAKSSSTCGKKNVSIGTLLTIECVCFASARIQFSGHTADPGPTATAATSDPLQEWTSASNRCH